jgi:hypothetical protein
MQKYLCLKSYPPSGFSGSLLYYRETALVLSVLAFNVNRDLSDDDFFRTNAKK